MKKRARTFMKSGKNVAISKTEEGDEVFGHSTLTLAKNARAEN